MESERNEAVITLNNQVGCLHTQIKSQLDSLEILVAEKSSLEKKLEESATLLKTQEGNYKFHIWLRNVEILILLMVLSCLVAITVFLMPVNA